MKFKSLVLTLTLCAAASTGADARTITVIYNGIVDYGNDLTGIFGVPNGKLDGAVYQARYVFDTTLGVRDSGSNYTGRTGSVFDGTTSPAIDLTLMINGITVSIPTGSTGSIQNANYGGATSVTSHSAGSFYDDGTFYQGDTLGGSIVSYSDAFPLSIYKSFNYVVQAGDLAQQYLQLLHVNYQTNEYSLNTYGVLIPQSVSSQVVGVDAVPEPSTWAVLGLGFGVIGLSLRRRSERSLSAIIT